MWSTQIVRFSNTFKKLSNMNNIIIDLWNSKLQIKNKTKKQNNKNSKTIKLFPFYFHLKSEDIKH